MVTIDVWRARIGGYHAVRCGHLLHPHVESTTLLSVAAFHCLVFLTLLVIGNVELNPGPESYKCSYCQKDFASIGLHCHHQKIHANIFNYLFECADPSCHLQFTSFASLNSHISRIHKEKRNLIESDDTQSFLCTYCDEEVKFSQFVDLCHHLLEVHLSVGLPVTCPLISECGRSEPFVTKNAYSGHLSKQHPGWRNWKPENINSEEIGNASCGNLASDFYDTFHDVSPHVDIDSDDEFYDAQDTFDFSLDNVFEFIARFYVMLEVECLLPVLKIDKICESLTLLSQMNQSVLRASLYGELESLKIEPGSNRQLLNKLTCNDPFYLAHHKKTFGPDLTSSHLRNKHYKESFPQVPVDFPNFVPRDPIDGERFAYVSIKQSLSHLFQDSSVQNELLTSFDRNAAAQMNDGTVLSDYMDGGVCQKRNLPARRIDLLIFQDGFSVTSMLTSVQNKFKTLGVYFTLGNLSPWQRTRLKAIHLIMLVLEKHCRKFRQKCWEKLTEELKDLEENGIEFMGKKLHVFVQFFIGDNLGSHFLGGFVEGFTASHFCRFCEVSKLEFKRNPNAVKPLRSQQRYELCALRMAGSNKTHCLGVKERSILNDLKNFKICDPGLPPCIGHDIFHGVAEWDLRGIINALVKKNWFTLELLNRRIASFKYSANDCKNKPAPISMSKDKKKKKAGLGGSAVQNWQLLQLLPFIIQDLIKNPNDPHWKLYILLKKICEYICAPKIRLSQVDTLEVLTTEYLEERTILPNKEKPKHHFFRHYAALIRYFGPLIHLWAMRFEQKHQFFKKVARTCNNFINILKTLSYKSQLLFSYENKGLRFMKTFESASPFDIVPSSFPSHIAAALVAHNPNLDSVKTTKKVCINGIMYKKGDLLILGTMGENLKVGWIEVILLEGVTVSFVLRNEVAEFNQQMGIYHIKASASTRFVTVVNQNTLLYPCVQAVYSFNEIDSFSLKHSLL